MIVPLARPTLTDIERGYINEILVNGDVGSGRFIEGFEKAWARKNKMKFGVACSNGASALFLALKAAGIGEGDKVIVPEFTMIAAPHAVAWAGARPIFADCSEDSTNMDVSKLWIFPDTKAIIITPIYGRPVDQKVYDFARENRLLIIEDFAEAHGIKPQGDITCYSFYGNKILTTGEGGMCLTNNLKWAEEMKNLRNMYFDKERSMIHPAVGYNLRMTNLQAAIGLAQVERFDEINKKRLWIQSTYDKYINPKFKLPQREVLWVYDIVVDDPVKMRRRLKRNGVDSRYFFKPMTAQPMYAVPGVAPHATKWSEKGLYLPVYFDMTENDIKYVCQALERIMPK